MQIVFDAAYRFSDRFAKLVYVNILWIAFSLLGGVVLGFAPATMAMFAVTRNWTRGGEEWSLFRLFWRKYRQEFWSANAVGGLWALALAVLALDRQALIVHSHLLPYVTETIFFAGVLVCIVGLLYTGPVFCHYQLVPRAVVVYALGIGFTHPIRTIGMIAGVAGMGLLARVFPVLGIAMGGSAAAYLVTLLARPALPEPIIKS